MIRRKILLLSAPDVTRRHTSAYLTSLQPYFGQRRELPISKNEEESELGLGTASQARLFYVHRGRPDDSCAVRWVLGISVHDCLDGEVGSAAELGGRQTRPIGSDEAYDLVCRRAPDHLTRDVLGRGWMVVMSNSSELQIKSRARNGRASGPHLDERQRLIASAAQGTQRKKKYRNQTHHLATTKLHTFSSVS
jgi:hypothetical protein